MNKDFLAFRGFPTQEQAVELQQLLTQNNIENILNEDMPAAGLAPYMGEVRQKLFEILVHTNDFERAEALLEHHAEQLMETVDSDYYLYNMKDNELIDILEHYDLWGEFDYLLARKILEERGEIITDQQLNTFKKKRIIQLAEPEKNQTVWIAIGYILAFLGGFLGIILGYTFWTTKKTLPNGDRVYTYSPDDRKNGKTIFYIGTIILSLCLIKLFFFGGFTLELQ